MRENREIAFVAEGQSLWQAFARDHVEQARNHPVLAVASFVATVVGAFGVSIPTHGIWPALAIIFFALFVIEGLVAWRFWRAVIETRELFAFDLDSDWISDDQRKLFTKDLLAVELQVGEQHRDDPNVAPEAVSHWTADTRSVVGSAFGFWEMHRFMGSYDEDEQLDPALDVERLPARLDYLRDLLQRADSLPLNADFDPRDVKQRWAEASELPTEEGTAQ